MSKAKLIIFAAPVVLTSSLILKFALGISFTSASLIILSMAAFPFLAKPLLKFSGVLLKGIADAFKPIIKGLGKLVHGITKGLKFLKHLFLRPQIMLGLLVGTAAYLMGYPLPQIALYAALTTTILYTPQTLKIVGHGIKAAGKTIQSFVKYLGKELKKVYQFITNIPFYYKLIGFGLALLVGAHPLAAFITGLLMPKPYRIDQYLLIGLAFRFGAYIPPAFGLFTYVGSGVLEPMIAGLLLHNGLIRLMIAYSKLGSRSEREPEPNQNVTDVALERSFANKMQRTQTINLDNAHPDIERPLTDRQSVPMTYVFDASSQQSSANDRANEAFTEGMAQEPSPSTENNDVDVSGTVRIGQGL